MLHQKTISFSHCKNGSPDLWRQSAFPTCMPRYAWYSTPCIACVALHTKDMYPQLELVEALICHFREKQGLDFRQCLLFVLVTRIWSYCALVCDSSSQQLRFHQLYLCLCPNTSSATTIRIFCEGTLCFFVASWFQISHSISFFAKQIWGFSVWFELTSGLKFSFCSKYLWIQMASFARIKCVTRERSSIWFGSCGADTDVRQVPNRKTATKPSCQKTLRLWFVQGFSRIHNSNFSVHETRDNLTSCQLDLWISCFLNAIVLHVPRLEKRPRMTTEPVLNNPTSEHHRLKLLK